MAKNPNMNTTESEIKAVAKAVRGALQRKGYDVPHSAMLDALASALNRRDWNKVKAAMDSPAPVAPVLPATESSRQARINAMLDTYTPGTWALLRLAHLTKNRLPQMALPNQAAREFALEVLDSKLEGTLNLAGWVLPATLNLVTSSVDVGDFGNAEHEVGEFSRLISGTKIQAQVAYTPEKGWYLTKAGMTAMCEQLEAWVSKRFLCEVGLYREFQELPGHPVTAWFRTDDHEHEERFDARPYLLQTTTAQIKAIIECGYGRDYATDSIAEWEGATFRNKDVADGFSHLSRQTRDLGFECWVDAGEMLDWLAVYRAQDLADILCELFHVELSEAQDEEIKGRWDWRSAQDACDISFETKAEAAMDAFLRCSLLNQAKANIDL